MVSEIWVVPFFGQGHLLPSMELCKHIASRNFKAVLVIASNLSSSVPSSLLQLPLLEVIELPSSPPPPPPPDHSSDHPPVHFHKRHTEMVQKLEDIISTRSANPETKSPVCAVVDVMVMGWTAGAFQKFGIPIIGFFTSGACSAAMEYALWKSHPLDLKPGELRLLPGLPEEMAISVSDLKQRPHGHGPPPGGKGGPPPPGFPGPPPGGIGPKNFGPPKPGDQPPWLEEASVSIAIMINTCDELEHPFLQYLSGLVGKPVWGVGPLLPEQYWNSAGSILHDRQLRTNNRQSNVTEEEVIAWLDSKARGSVLYVSFGSEVGPDMEEYPELAEALEASKQPFIWVIQAGAGRRGPPPQITGRKGGSEDGYFPHGLDKRVGERGLIIHGWAPQLMILSHPSTGGFLSHCGWNSTVEAIGRGVPFLAWPIRGDQFYNAKLVVRHLKIGYMISEDASEMKKRDEIGEGVEKLMGDEEIKKRAALLGTKFQHGFPASSMASFDCFRDFINN